MILIDGGVFMGFLNGRSLNDVFLENKTIVDVALVFGVFITMIFAIQTGLFISFLFGVGTFLIVRVVETFIEKKLMIRSRSRLFATFIISSFFLALLVMGFYYLINTTVRLVSDPNEIINNMSMVIDKTLKDLPSALTRYIPSNIDEIKDSILTFIKTHLVSIRGFGKETTHIFINILFGSVIGIMIGYTTFILSDKVVVNSFRDRMANLVNSYKHIVVAQFAISLFNTVMTTVFLYVLKLPFIGIEFPFIKTIIVLTFLFGLIPIFGNIVVNMIVLMIGLSVSITAGTVALIYLIVIHKFEYVLNAKIIGSRTNSKAWELLLSMLIMESMFGIVGLIAAPILYTYLKGEFSKFNVI